MFFTLCSSCGSFLRLIEINNRRQMVRLLDSVAGLNRTSSPPGSPAPSPPRAAPIGSGFKATGRLLKVKRICVGLFSMDDWNKTQFWRAKQVGCQIKIHIVTLGFTAPRFQTQNWCEFGKNKQTVSNKGGGKPNPESHAHHAHTVFKTWQCWSFGI